MNQNILGVKYFDENNTNSDYLTFRNSEDTNAANLEVVKSNYKARHKDDLNSKGFIARAFDLFKPAIIISAFVLFVFSFIFLNGIVPSGSMESTIMTNTFIMSNRLAYVFDDVERGDVVVFYSDEHKELLVKRVIGVAGDKIDIKNGSVYVNGCLLEEDYIQGNTYSKDGEDISYNVPEGTVFVMGDNREHSGDSRYFANPYVSIDSIKGEVFLNYSISSSNGIYAQLIHSEKAEFVGADFIK